MVIVQSDIYDLKNNLIERIITDETGRRIQSESTYR